MSMNSFTKSRLRLALASLTVCLTATTGAQTQWTPVGPPVSGIPNSDGQYITNADYNDLVFDSSGHPYVVINDMSLSYKATVVKYDGTNWNAVGNAGFSDGSAVYPSIAKTSKDSLYVVYRDGGSGANIYSATCKKFDGTSWVTVGANKFSAGTASYTRIEIGNNDVPFVAFSDFSGSGIMALGGKVTVMRFDGTSWVPVGTRGFSAGAVSSLDFKIDGTGGLWVAYTDNANSGAPTVKKWDGSTWVTVGTGGYTGTTRDVTIDFDKQNTPYIAFRDVPNSSRVTVMKLNGTTWNFVGTAGFSNPVVATAYDIQYRYVVLKIDEKDRPCVAYTDAFHSGSISVMRYDGTNWDFLGRQGFSKFAKCLSIGEFNKNLYVTYINHPNSSGPWPGYAMKYDMCELPDVQSLTASKRLFCAGDSTVIRIEGGRLNDADSWKWYSGNCGGNVIATGDTLRVTPGDTTVYYVSGEGGCVQDPVCDSIRIIVNPQPTPVVITIDGFVLSTLSNYYRFQWYRDGIALPDGNKAFCIVDKNGRYMVEVFNEGGCSDTASYVVSNVDVQEISQQAATISVYPNPASNVLHVNSPVNAKVTISSIEGKQLITSVGGGAINLVSLSKGVYIVRITDDNGALITTTKIVKVQ